MKTSESRLPDAAAFIQFAPERRRDEIERAGPGQVQSQERRREMKVRAARDCGPVKLCALLVEQPAQARVARFGRKQAGEQQFVVGRKRHLKTKTG